MGVRAVQVHDLRRLPGSLPERERPEQLYRPGSDLPGSLVQRSSDWRDEQARASGGADGRRRHRRLRQLAELRPLLPERHSADDFDRRDEQGYDEAYVQEMARYVVL